MPTTVTEIKFDSFYGIPTLTTIVNPTGRALNCSEAFGGGFCESGNTFVTGTCGSVEIVDHE